MEALLYPFALRTAKTLWSFGHSECNRVNHTIEVEKLNSGVGGGGGGGNMNATAAVFLCLRDNSHNSQGALRFAPVCPSVCPSVRSSRFTV